MAELSSPPPAVRNHAWRWMALAVIAIASAFWVFRKIAEGGRFDWHTFGATLWGLDWWWLAAAVVSVFAGYFVRALRWRVLMLPVKETPGLWNLFSATIVGFAALAILGRPGEFVRPYLIAVKERVSFSSQFAALVLERIYDLLLVLAIFGFALSRVRHSGMKVGPALSGVFAMGGWLVGSLAAAVLGALLLFRRFSALLRTGLLRLLEKFGPRFRPSADRFLAAFVQGVESTRSRKGVLLAVWYSIVEWLTIAFTTYFVISAFGDALHFGWLDVLIFLGFLAFGAVVQIPGIGGGMQVVSVVVLTELLRVPLEIATSVALVLWIISFVVIVPPGVILALHDGLRWRTLRRLESEVSV